MNAAQHRVPAKLAGGTADSGGDGGAAYHHGRDDAEAGRAVSHDEDQGTLIDLLRRKDPPTVLHQKLHDLCLRGGQSDRLPVIALLLEKEGYRVLKAYDGMEALRILAETEVQLIIMDVKTRMAPAPIMMICSSPSEVATRTRWFFRLISWVTFSIY